MLREISQTEKGTPYDFTYIWNLKNKMHEQTKQQQTVRYRKQAGGCQMGEEWEVGLEDGYKKAKGLKCRNW